MALTKNEFEVLFALGTSGEGLTQRQLSENTGMSLGRVNTAVAACERQGFVQDRRITEAGIAALEPYEVDNAVIMAAGMSSRFAPISYEKPKGMLKVRGEVLVERQIRQLLEVGISDITVVVGYMKEYFFYLHGKYGVKIVVNPDYATRNNNSTLYLVRDRLANTFVCSSDDYFTVNPFERYVYQAYYASEYVEGPTDEWCMTTGRGHRITGVTTRGGHDAWVMLGHVYFDRAFSKKFVEILERVYDLRETAGKLWEKIFAEHVDELPMVLRPYPAGVINEFDSLDELRDFDPAFIENVDSSVLTNIATTLGCAKSDVADIVPIKRGLTNMSFHFSVNGELYVYRHPGVGTAAIISRQGEAFAQSVARELDLDDTFIYEDPVKGWKLSHFIPGCEPFDYHNEHHLEEAMRIGRTLHQSGRVSKWSFDVYQKAREIVTLLDAHSRTSFPDFDELTASIAEVHDHLVADAVPACLCHNDFYDPNFLVHDGQVDLIDWEYSGMSDYASDLGTFICCSDYTDDEVAHVLEEYFQRQPTPRERAHCLGYVALSGYYWFVWAIYQEVKGNPVDEYLYLWYRYAQSFSAKALAAYEQLVPAAVA